MGAKLDFIADVIETGTIMGLDANLGPDAATAVMGHNCGENRSGEIYWRSYGLVEISWYERKHGLGWKGQHFGVQAHRLQHGDELLDDAVAARYGRFGGLVMFDDLLPVLARRGIELVEIGEPLFGHQQYWQPDAQVTLYVGLEAEHHPGSVQKIFSVFGQDLGNTHQADHRVVWRQMKEVVNLSGPARVRWAERQAPEDFRSWWRYCTRLTAHRVYSIDHVRNREEFVAFVFWMWAHGLERGAFTPREVALHQAEFVAGLEENHPDITDVPSHDALVRACLDHVTTAMTRDDKNLIDAASLLRHGLTDPARFDETHARRIALPGPGL